jgi:hypothetical protein
VLLSSTIGIDEVSALTLVVKIDVEVGNSVDVIISVVMIVVLCSAVVVVLHARKRFDDFSRTR